MKRAILLLLLLRTLQSDAQVQSDCTVPAPLESSYSRDVVQLATNFLFQTQSPDTALVHIPAILKDEIMGGLAAILNATSIPESDSVFNLYCVHNANGWPYEYVGFLVRVDTSYAWTQAWQNLVTITGNATIDSLTTKYALLVVNFYNWSIGNYAELSVDSSWNIRALMDSISYAPGVISAEPNTLLGLAGWIDYQKNGNDRIYDFYFEFNDCFDGCDNYHRWRFKVDADCKVTYLGFLDWGVFGIVPLPAPLNCNLFSTIPEFADEDIVVFPNPANDFTVVNRPAGNSTITPCDIKIYNLMGELQLGAPSKSAETRIDVSSLTPGVYMLALHCRNQNTFTLFIKN